MPVGKNLSADEIEVLKSRKIDLSDIPEMDADTAGNLYPRCWKPVKKAVSARIDMDVIEWLQEPGTKGYLQRLNAVLRWARKAGCPINEL